MDFLRYIKEQSNDFFEKYQSATIKPKILPKPQIFNGKVTKTANPQPKLANDDLIDFTAELVEAEPFTQVDWKLDKQKKPVSGCQLDLTDRCRQVLDALKNVLLMNSGLFF